MVFDLDPPKRQGVKLAVIGALALKELLEKQYQLKPWVMTTGSKGLHVVVALRRTRPYSMVRERAREIAERLVETDPKRFTLETRKEKRQGRLYIDTMRNAKGAMVVAPYALRPLPEAPVAQILTWKDLLKYPIPHLTLR